MGALRPQLVYKTARYGSVVTVAHSWFAFSQLHHGHTLPDGTPRRLVGKHKLDKQLVCPITAEFVDRDANAARNLRDWPDHASCGPVTATAPSVLGPTGKVGTGHGGDGGTSAGADGASVTPRPAEPKAKTQTPQGDAAVSVSPKHTQRQRLVQPSRAGTTALLHGQRADRRGTGELRGRGLARGAAAGLTWRLDGHRLDRHPRRLQRRRREHRAAPYGRPSAGRGN